MMGAREDRRDLLFDSFPSPMYIFDLESLRFLAVNDAMVSHYGYTREELLRMNLKEIRPPCQVALLTEAITAFPQRYHKHPDVWLHQKKDGTPIRMEIHAHRIVHEGKPAGMVMALDVTARMEASIALEQSEERYRVVADVTSDSVWDWNLATDLVMWNDSFTKLFGHILERSCTPLDWWAGRVHPEDRERVVRGLQESIDSGADVWEAEYRFERADGSWAQVLDRGRVIRDSEGKSTRMIGAMVDLTKQKEMQARLALADRMASVGTLAAGVAHEINNPLAFILASIDYAMEEIGRSAAPSLGPALNALQQAREGGERVRTIVRDLRIFSRPEKERLVPVDVRKVIETSIAMAEGEVRHRAVLVADLQEVPSVLATDSRLGQIVLNLLVNAAQSFPTGEASRHEIRVATRCDRGTVVIEVRDNGSGIPPEVLPRIFDPFFTMRRVTESTGLGLAICHGIVKNLGGEIQVESDPGKGSVFRVLLPSCEAAPVTAEEPPAREPAPKTAFVGRGRLLVVDDEPMFAEAVRRMLARDHDIEISESAADALGRFERGERFDLILCDLMMPDMTGMDLHHEMEHVAKDQQERMIFLTGGVYSPAARKFLEAQNAPVLEKAFAPDMLRDVIAQRLSTAKV